MTSFRPFVLLVPMAVTACASARTLDDGAAPGSSAAPSAADAAPRPPNPPPEPVLGDAATSVDAWVAPARDAGVDAAHGALPLGAPCTSDDDCSGGAPGTERVCSTASSTCIAACHHDTDCPAGEVCDTASTWRCAPPAPPVDAAAPVDAAGPIVAGYSPDGAVTYAEAHWDDGAGECAQFVSDSAITAGGLPLGYTTWVPTLYTELAQAGVAYDEYTPSQTSLTACPGDIVVYSNGAGADFCLPDATNVPEQNCGHTGLVVTGGTDADAILADFHNNAHQHMALTGILTGTEVSSTAANYSTMRVYHLSHCAFY